jgi:hypothetical protein
MLKPKVALAFGTLYLLTVSLLVARYIVSGSSADVYLELAIQQGAKPIGDATVVTLLRIAVFLTGTFLSLWLLYLNSQNRDVGT